jgi:phage terminase large subunit-like protein
MLFQKKPPLAVLLNGISRRDKAETADLILPVINA